MKKRRHHYVWKNYLNSWVNNDLIWCCREGKVFNPNLVGVTQERDFYDVKELSEKDIEIINKLVIERASPHLQKINKTWLESYIFISKIKQRVKLKGVTNLVDGKKLMDLVHNFEEDFHCGIESRAIKYMESIRNENIDFYETADGRTNFSHYISVQYMRTKRIKSSVLMAINDSGTRPMIENIENIWNVLSHIFAVNIAWGIDDISYHMILLKNTSEKELITGDQPVINTYANKFGEMTPVESLEYYYPVSPKIAILITNDINLSDIYELELSEAEIEKYNKMIVEQSHNQIFSSSREVLLQYVK